MGSLYKSYSILNPVVLDDFPEGVESLSEGDSYIENMANFFNRGCVVDKSGKVYQTGEISASGTGNWQTAKEVVFNVELFKGYDGVDYSGSLYSVAPQNQGFWFRLTKPGCYVIELVLDGVVAIKRRLVQACKIDVPYDCGGYADAVGYMFSKAYKPGIEIQLGSVKVSYFVDSHSYLWDSVYDYPAIEYKGTAISRLTGKVYVPGKSGGISMVDNLGTFAYSYSDGTFAVTGGEKPDETISVLSKDGIRVYYNSSPTIVSGTIFQLTGYKFLDNISYIRRVGGSQLFCYMEDDTVVPFQRTGKNLYGYGAVQLSGVDYGSYMEVSVNGEDSVVMDYWQKRGIYVPKGV